MNEQEKAIDEAVRQLSDAVNVLGSNGIGKYLSKSIQKQHRTLQQSIWRAIIQAIDDYSKTASSDLRNVESVTACGYLAKIIDQSPKDFFLPFV